MVNPPAADITPVAAALTFKISISVIKGFAAIVPVTVRLIVSEVPEVPLIESPGLNVSPAVVPVAANPVMLLPEAFSAPVVSDLIICFDTLLILNSILSILLDIKRIAYDAPIFNCKSR